MRLHWQCASQVTLLDHYAIPDVQAGKQLHVRGEVEHFYGSNQLSTAALLRFF